MILSKSHYCKQVLPIPFIVLILIWGGCSNSAYNIPPNSIAVTEEGIRVILNKDRSWEYAGEESLFSIIIDSKKIAVNGQIASRAVRFKDGDTFEIFIDKFYPGFDHKETVRLLGVDSPELRKGEYFANEALEYLSTRLTGENLYLIFDQKKKRDSFCRLLAYVCLKDGTCINAELISKGYAQLYTQQKNRFYNEFAALQTRAIKERAGLWGKKKTGVFIIYIYNHKKEEYLLLANGSPDDIDISNWYIVDEYGDKLIIPANTVITPKEDLKLCSGDTDCDSLKTTFYLESRTIWSNKGDTAYLYSSSDSLVDVYRY